MRLLEISYSKRHLMLAAEEWQPSRQWKQGKCSEIRVFRFFADPGSAFPSTGILSLSDLSYHCNHEMLRHAPSVTMLALQASRLR